MQQSMVSYKHRLWNTPWRAQMAGLLVRTFNLP